MRLSSYLTALRLRACLKVLLYTLGSCVVLIGLLLLAGRLAFERIPRYQSQIEAWLYRQTGYHLVCARMSPELRWSGLELYLDRLELRSKDGQRVLARARNGRIGMDPWQVLHHGRLFRFELDEPAITLRRIGPATFAIGSDLIIGGEPSARTLADWPDGTLAIRRGRITIEGWNEMLPALALERVDLDVRHGERLLAIGLAARLPPVLGNELRMSGTAHGAGPAALLDWQGTISARQISFAGWKRLLPDYLGRLDGGSGAFELQVSGHGTTLAHAQLGFDARHVATGVGEGIVTVFDEVGGGLTLDHAGERWEAHGRRLRARVPGRVDPESQFDVTWRASEAGLLALEAGANYLRAEALLPLAGLVPQPELRARLRDIAPSGEWLDMHVALSRSTPAEPFNLDCQARFRDVGFAPVGRAPGLRGLSGSLAGNQSGGHIEIEGPHALLSWPLQFPHPLPLSGLKTTLYWSRTPEQFLVATPALSFATHAALLRAKVAWSSPSDDSSPRLTLAGTVEGGDAGDAHFFFPHALLPPKVLAWLDRAFVKGHLQHADLVFAGPVRHFPFRDGSGLFLVRALIDDLTLDYHEGWPRIDGLNVLAEFRNQGMDVKIAAAHAGGLIVDSGEARFPDFVTGELEVQAQAHGDADDALGYLKATPLDALAEHGFSSTDAHGPLRCGLSLYLPFREFDHRRVQVHLDVHGATVARAGSSLSASEVSGVADIDGAQVAHADMHGRLLGGPFQMSAREGHKRPTRTVLDFRGTLAGEALRQALSLPASAHLGGETEWHATLRLSPEPTRERSLKVTSNLAGLALDLPAPLAKTAAATLPASFEAQWPADAGMQLKFKLDSLLQGAMNLEAEPTGWHVGRIALALGGGEPTYSDAQLLNVSGRVEQLDLSGWMRLAAMPKGARPLTSYLTSASIQVHELGFLGLTFRDVALAIAAQDSGWRIGVTGPNATGLIRLPLEPGAPLSIDFERLQVSDGASAADTLAAPESGVPPPAADLASPAAAAAAAAADAAQGGAPKPDPRALPSTELHIGELSWGERRLGEVRATLVHLDDGVSLKLLTMTAATYSVSATGDWRGREGGTLRLDGRIRSTDVAGTLRELSFPPSVEAKSGSLEFKLAWAGLPSGNALAAATGELKLALDNGQIVHLKPGAGRVLGLASLTELPRRLAFDFSDLTDKGFAFDTIRGTFKLKGDGSAYTEDVLVRGPAAEIGLIGRVGLKNEDYDQTAVVTGNLGNSPLPFAAFAGGPVVGAAVVLFTQVFKQPLQGLVRGYYRITGPWENPTVERIKGADAKADAAPAKSAEAAPETVEVPK